MLNLQIMWETFRNNNDAYWLKEHTRSELYLLTETARAEAVRAFKETYTYVSRQRGTQFVNCGYVMDEILLMNPTPTDETISMIRKFNNVYQNNPAEALMKMDAVARQLSGNGPLGVITS